jgi:hypothetical protein
VTEPAPGVAAATEAPTLDVPPAAQLRAAPGAAEPVAQPLSAEPAPPAQGAPAPSDAPSTVQTPEGAPAPGAPAAEAHNQSRTVQAILQFQRGCQRHCYGTAQTQDATQRAQTTQEAQADGRATGSAAGATNQSSTVQFVWQVQLGCVAFCFDTRQNQTAFQSAQTTQSASAVSDALALALNAAETLQIVLQQQRGCEEECHGATSSQSVAQDQWLQQSAIADGPGALGWLTAVAANLGVSLQTVLQYQDADCLEHCYGGIQAQQALQEAIIEQQALAGKTPGTGPPPASSPDPGPQAPGSVTAPAPVAPDTRAHSTAAEEPSATGPHRNGRKPPRRTSNSGRPEPISAGFTQSRVSGASVATQDEAGDSAESAAAVAYRSHVNAALEGQRREAKAAAASASPAASAATLATEAELQPQSRIPARAWIAAGLSAIGIGIALQLFARAVVRPSV